MNRRRVFTFVEGQPDDVPATEKGRQLDEMIERHFGSADALRPSVGATAEQTLSGLLAWAEQWIPRERSDGGRIMLIWDSGHRDKRAATYVAAADPEAFYGVLMMAMPREWAKA